MADGCDDPRHKGYELMNGCFNREPFKPYYYATGGNKPIPHVLSKDCEYKHSNIGKTDPKCDGCKHKELQPMRTDYGVSKPHQFK